MLVERYIIRGGVRGELPKHTHDEYQISTSFTDTRTYLYRSGRHPVHPGNISIVHPGEVHGGAGLPIRDHATEVFTFYVPATLVQQINQDSGATSQALPYVDLVHRNPTLAKQLVHLYRAVQVAKTTLGTEELWQNALSSLFPGVPDQQHLPVPDNKRSVRLIREYLDAHCNLTVSLPQLAQVAGLTAWHVSRLFHKEVGMTLHRYQMQRRVDLAKRLLFSGMPVGNVATECGFTHQSHLGRYFTPIVQVAPGSYQKRKTVL